ncbi:hypothetical protein Dimus_023079 [Dionaea muscipula]
MLKSKFELELSWICMPLGEEQAFAAGTLAEFYESQERWGREISTEERNKMIEAASWATTVRQVNQIDHKFSIIRSQEQIRKVGKEKILRQLKTSEERSSRWLLLPLGQPWLAVSPLLKRKAPVSRKEMRSVRNKMY